MEGSPLRAGTGVSPSRSNLGANLEIGEFISAHPSRSALASASRKGRSKPASKSSDKGASLGCYESDSSRRVVFGVGKYVFAVPTRAEVDGSPDPSHRSPPSPARGNVKAVHTRPNTLITLVTGSLCLRTSALTATAPANRAAAAGGGPDAFRASDMEVVNFPQHVMEPRHQGTHSGGALTCEFCWLEVWSGGRRAVFAGR